MTQLLNLVLYWMLFLSNKNCSDLEKHGIQIVNVNMDSIPGGRFNAYILDKFNTLYSKYFSEACDTYNTTAKFRVDSAGRINDMILGKMPVYINDFLKEALLSSTEKWQMSYSPDKATSSKVFVLPVYFNFTDHCGNPPYKKRTHDMPDIGIQIPVMKGDFAVSKETSDSVILWPLVCNGHFIQRNAFDKPSKKE